MKYARREFERRFLLEGRPAGLPEEYRVMDDHYFPGTTLRLRLVRDPSGRVLTRKLNKKHRDETGRVWITTLYLSESEYELFRALPALHLHKHRYSLEAGERKIAVDVIADGGVELVLAELEGDSAEAIESAHGVPVYEREVTDDPQFRGYQIAVRFFSDAASTDQDETPAHNRDDEHARTPGAFTSEPAITLLDHVQLAMPAGVEPQARAFFADVLGMDEEQKPALLASRGGCWFRAGKAVLHLGVETPFTPQKKAHPAFRVRELDQLALRLHAHAWDVTWDHAIPGLRRFYTEDPFGNRLEFVADNDGVGEAAESRSLAETAATSEHGSKP